MPGANVRAGVRGKIWIEREKIAHGGRGFAAPTEMPTGRGHDQKGPEKSGHIHPVRTGESLLVFSFVEMIPERSEMHPTRMIGIQLHRSPNDRSAALELARVHNLQSQNAEGVSVEGVERHRAFCRRTKGSEILPKEMR